MWFDCFWSCCCGCAGGLRFWRRFIKIGISISFCTFREALGCFGMLMDALGFWWSCNPGAGFDRILGGSWRFFGLSLGFFGISWRFFDISWRFFGILWDSLGFFRILWGFLWDCFEILGDSLEILEDSLGFFGILGDSLGFFHSFDSES